MEPLKIALDSYPDTEAKAALERLKSTYEKSDKKHTITEHKSADIILITGPGNNVSSEEYIQSTFQNKTIQRFPLKTFTLSYRYDPIILSHGIYESPSTKNPLNWNRTNTGWYAVAGSFNPTISALNKNYSPPHDRNYLISFTGRNSHYTRGVLFNLKFKREDVYIQDTSAFDFWGEKDKQTRTRMIEDYFNILSNSKFCICPRGSGSNSIRLYESMKAGIAPIIIADKWQPPYGPKWDDFAIFVKEKKTREIESIAERHENEYLQMGTLAQIAFNSFFSQDQSFNHLVASCVQIRSKQIISETFYWHTRQVIKSLYSLRNHLRKQ